MFNKKRRPEYWLKRLGIILALVIAALMLSACQVYDGYPTTTPEPTAPPTNTVIAAVTARPTLPPAPTLPPRPTLPPAPANVQLQKADIMKKGFDALLNNYFLKLDSADSYEVGLRSIQSALESAGVQNPQVPIPDFSGQPDANWKTFLQAFTIIFDKYKSQVSEDTLEQVALAGAASALQDCQTSYIPASVAEEYYQIRTGQQSIIGIGINLQSGTANGRNVHFVTRPIAGGPAVQAGIQNGDQILAVDGKDVSTLTSTDVVKLIQGTSSNTGTSAAGSKVVLTVAHPGSNQSQDITITRASIQLPNIERQTINGNIGYIHFNRFPLTNQNDLDTASKNLGTWLQDFSKAGVKGLVLDLRGNSYGSIAMVQNYLSYFIDKQDLVYLTGVRIDQNNTPRYGSFPVPRYDTVQANTTLPVSVIVDGSTSGEAEIFAYALQQDKRATIVGDTTNGCLSASRPIPLDDNSLMNITSYRAISDVAKPDSLVQNVVPDQKAPVDLQQLSQGKDNQLDAAIQALNK
ncbi:MAG TPA: S41 family peptidase [Chloroflexia bacterium]|nr:S41 family peptidase [Chloroflexia bacterium]